VSAQRRTDLERLFDHLNAHFFDDRIAPLAVRRSNLLVRLHGCDGLYERGHDRIVIQSGLSSQTERRVLIHEMCHARLPSHHGHGRPFLAQLHRLARRGERWALDEAERYLHDPWLRLVDALDGLDHQWHALTPSASRRSRAAILARADRLLAKL
jgi:SprT-like family protein